MSNKAMCAAIAKTERECDRVLNVYGSFEKHDELNELSLDELSKLNKMVLDMLKTKRVNKSLDIKHILNIGDIVSVNSKKANDDIFEVVKLNPKKAVIKDELGVQYNCPYSLINIV